MSSNKQTKRKPIDRKQTHVLRLPDRTIELIITESENYVVFNMTMTIYGWSEYDDREEFDRWLMRVLDPYVDDPRPMVVPDPQTGEIAVIGCRGSQLATLIFTPPRNSGFPA